MVLPDRIELSTSPLPRECSTTELRQHAGRQGESARKHRHRRSVLAISPLEAQARENPEIGAKAAIAQPLPAPGGPAVICVRFRFSSRAQRLGTGAVVTW
jgi:hypothetical protein